MDVLLTMVSLSLSSYLPQCLQPPSLKAAGFTQSPPLTMRIAASLSFLLLAMSIIDSVPMSWLFVLNERLLPLAYRMLLMLMVTCVLVVFPSLAGAQFVSGRSGSREDSRSLSTRNSPLHQRRPTTFLGWMWRQVVSFLGRLLSLLFQCVLWTPLGKYLVRIRTNNHGSSALLPTTAAPSPSPTVRGCGCDGTYQSRVSFSAWSTLPWVGALVAVGLTVGLVSTISPWFVRTTSTLGHHSFRTMPILSITVSWLCSVGIFLSACINGFGSVSLPYSCIAGLYLEPIADEAIQRAQQEMATAQQSLQERQHRLLAQLSRTSPSSGTSLAHGVAESPPVSGNAIWRKKQSFGWGLTASVLSDSLQATLQKQLTQEIDFLTTLIHELEQEVTDMRQSQVMAAQARTPWGRIRSWLGVVLSILLVVRLLAAAWFIWRHDHPGHDGSKGGGSSDPVTLTVLWLIGHNYVSQQQYNTLSQVISLVLTGYLSVSQVRTFVRASDAVHRRLQQCWRPSDDAHCEDPSVRRLSPLHRMTSGTFTPLIGSLMCCYFLACVVLTKLLVPAHYRRALATALQVSSGVHSPTEKEDDERLLWFFVRIRSYAVNSVFLSTAMVSTVILAMILGIQRGQSLRHRPLTVAGVLIESA